jgi:hypothetical protein
MADAPVPGASLTHKIEKAEAQAERRAPKPVMTFTLLGETRKLDLGLVTLDDQADILRATKMSYELIMGSESKVAIVAMWWLAGRQSGINKSWRETVAEFPDEVGDGDFEVEVETPDAPLD